MRSSTSHNAPWLQWLGMPYKLGAHPSTGAADCLQLTLAVLELAGQPAPQVDRAWYRLAAAGRWDDLRRMVIDGTDPAAGGQAFDVALLPGGDDHRLGFGVCCSFGLLTATPEHGVHWRGLHQVTPEHWFRFRR
jgi:hypothetical protein